MYKLIGTLIGGGVVLVGSWAMLEKSVDAQVTTPEAIMESTRRGGAG